MNSEILQARHSFFDSIWATDSSANLMYLKVINLLKTLLGVTIGADKLGVFIK